MTTTTNTPITTAEAPAVPRTVRAAQILLVPLGVLTAYVGLALLFFGFMDAGTDPLEGSAFAVVAVAYLAGTVLLGRGSRAVWSVTATVAGAHLVFNAVKVATGETESLAILVVLVAVLALLTSTSARRFFAD